MAARTMRAAYVRRLGGAEEIEVGELDVPDIGASEVLVAVHAVTVNPVDTFVRSGGFATPTPFPFIIGRDLVGTVERVGEGAPGFAEGQWVWCNSLGHGGRQGSFAQYAAAPADRLYALPDGVDPLQAVALAHPAATAWLGLFVHAQLRLAETILVGGGAGNVGDATIRLAAAAGARVIATASARDLTRCREAGAAVAVDYRAPDALDQIRRAAPDGLDVHWDTSGHHDFDSAVPLMARRGRILLTAAGPRSHVPLPVGAAYTGDVDLLGFVISNATVTELADAARALNAASARGLLRADIVDTLPLTAAAEAHRRIERGEVSGGRLILRP